jgi:hypothetical protein
LPFRGEIGCVYVGPGDGPSWCEDGAVGGGEPGAERGGSVEKRAQKKRVASQPHQKRPVHFSHTNSHKSCGPVSALCLSPSPSLPTRHLIQGCARHPTGGMYRPWMRGRCVRALPLPLTRTTAADPAGRTPGGAVMAKFADLSRLRRVAVVRAGATAEAKNSAAPASLSRSHTQRLYVRNSDCHGGRDRAPRLPRAELQVADRRRGAC